MISSAAIIECVTNLMCFFIYEVKVKEKASWNIKANQVSKEKQEKFIERLRVNGLAGKLRGKKICSLFQ